MGRGNIINALLYSSGSRTFMKFIADLHFHSKYSRAVSPQMELVNLAEWGRKKGIDILTTTDFTHPLWFREIKVKLKEIRSGIYQLNKNGLCFILTTEISLIFPQHRIHLIILAPNLNVVGKINQVLTRRNFNLLSDGRPIFGISAHDFVGLIKDIDPLITFIPAHIWTPWFSLYGSRSGFDSINQCFGEYASEIPAIETGLSSDPLMNWQIKELDSKTIISGSDSHSLKNLGRNATIFELPKNFAYQDIVTALKTPYSENLKSKPHVSLTIEFYPEQGKYHYTGHRKCGVCHSPEDSEKLGTTCPVCGKPLTVGVMHQVKKLSRKEKINPKVKEVNGLRIFYHPENLHHPFISLIQLREIISEVEGVGPQSQKVKNKYNLAIGQLGNELNILTKIPISTISKILGERIAEGIEKNRKGDIYIGPGYDGIYGKVKVWKKEEKTGSEKEQIALF